MCDVKPLLVHNVFEIRSKMSRRKYKERRGNFRVNQVQVIDNSDSEVSSNEKILKKYKDFQCILRTLQNRLFMYVNDCQSLRLFLR